MSPLLALLLVVLLIAANGLFVAAEFAFVAVQRGVIEERAEAGDRRARAARQQLQQLSVMLSGAQFGITATSLLVGFLAEDSVGALLQPVLELVGLPERSVLAISVTLAFALSTAVQMVVGELAPKNLAIARPEGVALAVARPMRLYAFVFGPLIRFFDRSAGGVSRLFGVEPREELLTGHSLDELSRIVSASGQQGSITEEQTELLSRALGLGARRVTEVMVPRPDIVWLDAGASLEELARLARETGHSRFPVRGRSEDDVVGTVHVKDLLRVATDRRGEVPVSEVASTPLIVPESYPVRGLLTALRQQQRTFAVVVDEFGQTAGIATIEDVLEELVGQIEDEFDRDARAIRRVGAGRYLVHGTLRADRLAEALDVTVPEGPYETVAGFVLDQLGRIPEEGDGFVWDGWEVTVVGMDGHRVSELRFVRRTAAPSVEGRP